ncbi:MAG: endonuclease III [Provencibacterium sp.]|jgi:endonuclease-3|nr:endonuclease III [Provencibacterium sp.]
MTSLQEKAEKIVQLLEEAYPTAYCSLEHNQEKPHELLMSTRLSAQCTDARVNIVTKELFSRYPSIDAFAEADLNELEELVRPCGFYKMKARDLKNMAIMLRDVYHYQLPDTIEELTRLPGVGRKTANLIVGDIFGKPSVVCDTHCIRITNLLGLSKGKDPLKVEMQLREILPLDRSGAFCHRLVIHGRAVCIANRPRCAECVLKDYCDHWQALQAASDSVE